jgi:biopolymer transport protein ExbB
MRIAAMQESLPAEGADKASAGREPATPGEADGLVAGPGADARAAGLQPAGETAVPVASGGEGTTAPAVAPSQAPGDAVQPSTDAAQTPIAAPSGLETPLPAADPAAGEIAGPGLLGLGGLDDNPYGLLSLWQQGDMVIKGVAVVLLIMSILSWYLILTRGLRNMGLKRAARRAQGFWHAETFAEGLDLLGRRARGNPFRHLAEDGAHARDHHAARRQELHGQLSLSDWLTTSLRAAIDESAERMQSGLSILASIGSTAPFIGLFGTVWGIYHALVSIGVSGQAGIDKVAGPVGEALVMTAFGLAVAIPAVLGYNMLVRTNKGVLSQLNRFAHHLHAYFLTGAPVSRPELRLASFKREAG